MWVLRSSILFLCWQFSIGAEDDKEDEDADDDGGGDDDEDGEADGDDVVM